MQTSFSVIVAATGLFISANLQAQTNACDRNADGKVNVVDVQLAVNETGSKSVVDQVVNAALGLGCAISSTHSVSLTWTASTSTNVTYNVYRSATSNSGYLKINSAPVSVTSYTDSPVQAGQTYYYVATAVATSGTESAYSNQATAVIPTP